MSSPQREKRRSKSLKEKSKVTSHHHKGHKRKQSQQSPGPLCEGSQHSSTNSGNTSGNSSGRRSAESSGRSSARLSGHNEALPQETPLESELPSSVSTETDSYSPKIIERRKTSPNLRTYSGRSHVDTLIPPLNLPCLATEPSTNPRRALKSGKINEGRAPPRRKRISLPTPLVIGKMKVKLLDILVKATGKATISLELGHNIPHRTATFSLQAGVVSRIPGQVRHREVRVLIPTRQNLNLK